MLSFRGELLQTVPVTIPPTPKSPETNRFADYEPFVGSLRDLAGRAVKGTPTATEVAAALDGAANQALATLVERSIRRNAGAYFTSSAWRDQLDALLPKKIIGTWLDPACGAGDLLLCVAQRLAIEDSLRATLTSWGSQLYGTDLEPEFVEATRLRLLVCAASRFRAVHPNAPTERINNKTIFPNVQVGDGLVALRQAVSLQGIIMNPPFITQNAPKGTLWGSGGVSSAAVFLHDAVGQNHGSTVIAILPDVIRTGSRYGHLRREVQSRLTSGRVVATGIFGPDADIDVFVLAGKIAKAQTSFELQWWPQRPSSSRPLADFADVSVGSVVDNRDAHEGPERPYLTARALGRQKVINSIERRRQSDKTVVTPPFIVLRRTSRPEKDGRPLAPVLVVANVPVSVDNHLLIVLPHDRSEVGCQRIITALTSSEASRWIDERIRCRHLTTRAIAELPVPADVFEQEGQHADAESEDRRAPCSPRAPHV